ncbi:formate dehydrogenase accessory sulfurtransferase FdhD [Bradyrhizobium valentinum]|uniref:formate dehydrogenase accessory sulfurtransferase FdhD n=1 Tax=Bradyrhizobium valentinum TaxID=1518501 RepID=UPI0009EBF2DE
MHAGFFIGSGADIVSLDMVHLDDGVELRMWLSRPRADRLKERWRRMAGPTECGLCGIESIAEAVRPTATIGHGGNSRRDRSWLPWKACQRAKYLISRRAPFTRRPSGLSRAVSLRWEDVGCHNALDKPSGALASPCLHCGERGYRTSHQQGIGGDVPKAASIGAPAPAMVSISAPTVLGWRMQRVSHLPPSRARTDSKCSLIRVESHRSHCGSDAIVISMALLQHYLIQ